jgi:hypothetical protein
VILKTIDKVNTKFGKKHVYIYIDHMKSVIETGRVLSAGSKIFCHQNAGHLHIEVSDKYTGGSNMTTYIVRPGREYTRNGGVQYHISGFDSKSLVDFFYINKGQKIKFPSNAGGTMSFQVLQPTKSPNKQGAIRVICDIGGTRYDRYLPTSRAEQVPQDVLFYPHKTEVPNKFKVIKSGKLYIDEGLTKVDDNNTFHLNSGSHVFGKEV